MSKVCRKHDPLDFDREVAWADTPFALWLGGREEISPTPAKDIRTYYGVEDSVKLKGFFDESSLRRLVKIHDHHIWLRKKGRI